MPLIPRGRLAALLFAAAMLAAPPALAQPNLSLAEAIGRALAADPGQAASAARLAAAQAAVRQAAVRPSPTLGVEVENFVGTGPYSGLDRSEATFTYERAVERGGKREARAARAGAELRIAGLRAQVRRLDLIRDVQLAYAEAQAAEAERRLAEARYAAAQASRRDIARRVAAARDPLFAGSRAEALLAQAGIARDRAAEAAHAARATLAAHWGGDPDLALDLAAFHDVRPPAEPPPADTPDLALLEAERDAAAAALRIEQARSVADPTFHAGVRYFGEGNAAALVAGAAIPLGARAANRGAVERAQAERAAAEQDLAAARVLRDREIARLTARLRALAAEADRIEAEVVPLAVRTVEQVTAGFNRGGFEYIDVTEAQRALSDARARRIEVLRDYHTGLAALDRLTARHHPLAIQTEEGR